ncbi:DEAD/DEAH box helicase [candidate division KSB1 bacterium]|nr:DEAD/DEAH box helicase [candidate division KSB1 bacterium]NIR72385.1 DEAD/DEAH box helicase [candidate division KSB1 bacterium]NIS23571.1 DEAD/DEAH box helicase [candidate division KSB1 bacterium]NIT70500.1 DEAD/DEAH box helicase [candidate division KSB1 bacterium]NIU24205.1 DEAD/DEAH box helicase [candidate division KSB1 bacterium]
MNLLQILDQLKHDPNFIANVTAWRMLPEMEAQYADYPESMNPILKEAVQQHGIKKLYTHQAESVGLILEGKNIVVVTPTASGKTLCYNLPVLNTVLSEPEARALYLFPTKALSQDQVAELHDLVTLLGQQIDFDLKTYTFDGDTPASARKSIRSSGHIVVTNPDMLHQGILPHHTKWVKLFENLRYVVIDELHNYRGVYGSHLANLVRRLKRICTFYGSTPQFVCCSATIANPKELATQITGESVELVNRNGAPRGEKHFILYNPPVVNRELGIRKSYIKEARAIARKFLLNDLQTIVFARSRLRVEVLVTYLRDLMRKARKSAHLIRGYRGGYLPTERRAIERGLRNGEISGVVSTNALELGIDIGQLQVAIMAGYPGTIASAWQQAGRAGRRTETSVAILVASSAPIDQYIVNHPDYFFSQAPESGVIDANNLVILLDHIKCAAFELPFAEKEKFGVETTGEVLDYLVENRVLHYVPSVPGNDGGTTKPGKYHWMTDAYPAEAVSLRSATPDNVVIIDTTNEERVVGEVNLLDAPIMLHENAIYIHESRQYHVDKLDWERQKAYVHQVEVDYYTDAHTETSLRVLDVIEEKEFPEGKKGYGEVNVHWQTTKYKKLKFETHENIGFGKVELPELEMHTTSYWWEFPSDIGDKVQLSQANLGDGLKALSNAMATVVAVYMMCDPKDIRSLPMVRTPLTQRPTIYVYDNHAGGVGFSQKIFHLHDEIKQASLDLIKKCGCETGCPSCVGPVLEVGEKGKESAVALLDMGMKFF